VILPRSQLSLDAVAMRNVLIINGAGFTACSHHRSSVKSLLYRAHEFDLVQETSVEANKTDNGLVPDLIVPRFLLEDWIEQGLQLCQRTWSSAKTFVLLCDRHAPQQEVPAALIDVDEFLFCPYQENEFLLRIKRLIRGTPRQLEGRRKPGNLDLLIGESEPFLKAIRKVGLLAQSKAPVVISGETGSGKELIARAIHYRSPRESKPFIPVNCGALPDDLFENELFGHLRGAYTNASSTEKGLIAEAEGGTLFLDEVDALSPAAQIKLLRFLQSGEYRPLGSSRSVVADVRVIAACNTDLLTRVKSKLFREDLLYRLNVLSLWLPALRDRGMDVLELAKHFLTVYAKEQKRSEVRLTDGALNKLLSYSWPGNVRELESVIQRALVLHPTEVLNSDDIELPSDGESTVSSPELFRERKSSAIGEFEKSFVQKLLAAHHGNISQAAKAAGKDRRSFQRLVSKHRLDRKSFI
jgi:DNA-binding NtrC family response regulator